MRDNKFGESGDRSEHVERKPCSAELFDNMLAVDAEYRDTEERLKHLASKREALRSELLGIVAKADTVIIVRHPRKEMTAVAIGENGEGEMTITEYPFEPSLDEFQGKPIRARS